jgi:hypothetical protein
MRNDERCLFAGATAAEKATDARSGDRAGEPPRSPPIRGVTARLRPYCDVRAAFGPWRRVALQAWAAREEAATVH